ncbi:MAG: hypothetical protein ABI822_04055, partial [Bryobacteraceae bacterium]
MATICEPMIGEIRQEAATTRRVLERVPEDKLSWKPHPKSMSLGQLCLHVAGIPGSIAKLAQVDEFDASQANFEARSPARKEEILATLEESTKA